MTRKLCVDMKEQPEYMRDIVTPTLIQALPEAVSVAVVRMAANHCTGQIILNFNQGMIQSFEVKEHTRL